MTGWRVGFGLFPPALVEASKNLAINSWTCLPPFVAAGAVAALSGSSAATAAMRDEFQAPIRVRRAQVANGLFSCDCATRRGEILCLKG